MSESENLQFDTEGRVSLSDKLLKHAKIINSVLFVGLGKTFQIWEPKILKNLRFLREKKLIKIDLT